MSKSEIKCYRCSGAAPVASENRLLELGWTECCTIDDPYEFKWCCPVCQMIIIRANLERWREAEKRCIYCGKAITRWDRFKGWFWKLPLRLNEVSYVWEHCCSYKCYGLQLEKMLRALATDTREVMDLADFLFSSVCKFITIEQVTENLDRMKTTEWAKSLLAAGYRKIGPSDNPYNFWHSRDGLGLE